LAQQQQLVRSAPTKVVHDRGASDPALLASATPTPLSTVRAGHETSGLHLAAPPPHDLVIVLQRFLI
jgi:hypothetical protein